VLSSIYLRPTKINLHKSQLLLSSFALFVLLFVSTISDAKARTVDEGMLRAAIIIGIMRYTTWQQAPEKNINVCLVGKSKSTRYLLALESTLKVHEKSIFVFEYDQQIKNKNGCQVLLLGAKKERPLSSLKPAKSTLVICDECSINKKKSAVLIRKSSDKIIFDVNTRIAKKYKIKFSSPMLELASKVN